MVLNNPFLSTFAVHAGQIAQMAQLYRQITVWLQDWKRQVESKPAGLTTSFDVPLPGGAPGSPPRVVRMMLTEEAYTFDGLWPALLADPATITVPPTSSYLVALGPDPVDLKSYDHEGSLAQGMEQHLAKIGEAASRIDRALQTLQTSSGRPFTAGDHATWAGEIGRAGQGIHEVLEKLVVEYARVSTEMAPHVKQLPELDGLSLNDQGRLGPPLYPIAYHVSNQQEFDRLVRGHQRLNAHLAYQGVDTLKIDRLGVPGKLVISSQKAPLELTNLTVDSTDHDLMVVAGPEVVFKGGLIEAGVMVRGRARFSGDFTIRGNLVLESLPLRRDRGLDEELKGRVLYNPALFSGRLKSLKETKNALLTHYALGLSPVPEEMEVLWLH
ncbi:MAG: hypothetical protein HY815_19795 [Candidatus Riflebacteria bacterium]|nr:hypothetical protein [Candidatus Riflebacteria bacterium]